MIFKVPFNSYNSTILRYFSIQNLYFSINQISQLNNFGIDCHFVHGIYQNLQFYVSKPTHKISYKAGVQKESKMYKILMFCSIYYKEVTKFLGISFIFLCETHVWLWFNSLPKLQSDDYLWRANRHNPQITNFSYSFTMSWKHDICLIRRFNQQ